jgi:hypothetical protein
MRRTLTSNAVCCLLIFMSVGFARSDEQVVSDKRPDGAPNRAAWMARGSFGIMTHYLIKPRGEAPAEKTADMNRIADNFDLDGFIRQFQESGADWLIFTLGQTTGYLCSSNAVFDERKPGHTPRRDVALEIAKRLKQLNKRLILYLPSHWDAAMRDGLDSGQGDYPANYFSFLREYSLKFGKLHHGWWFDSCQEASDEHWNEWLKALRAGNDEAVVAFSGAEFCCGGRIKPICPLEDYHAGEIHLLEDGKIRTDFLYPPGEIVVSPDAKLRKRGQEAKFYLPDGQFVGNVQWHGLLPIDLTFNPAIPNQFVHYSDKELFEFVRRVKAVGGAITINVPIDPETGRIPADSHSQLVRLSKSLARQSVHN